MISLNVLHDGLFESLQRLEAECKRAAKELALQLQDLDTVECGDKVELRTKRKQVAEKIQTLLGKVEKKQSKFVIIKNMLSELNC